MIFLDLLLSSIKSLHIIAHDRLLLITAPHICLASQTRLYVCRFLNPTVNAVAVPSSATTGHGTDNHLTSNTWYNTVGIVPNKKSQNILLRVQKRNSESLYDFPVCIFLSF